MKSELTKIKKVINRKCREVKVLTKKAIVKADDYIAEKRKIHEIKKQAKNPITIKDNAVVVSVTGFSKKQIETVRNLIDGFRKENEIKQGSKMPPAGQIYYTVNTDVCIIEERLSTADKSDKINAKLGNVFTSKEAAKEAVKRRKILIDLENFAKENNMDISNGKYYYIFMSNERGNPLMVSEYSEKVQGAVYFSSDVVAERAIRVIGEENIKKLFY